MKPEVHAIYFFHILFSRLAFIEQCTLMIENSNNKIDISQKNQLSRKPFRHRNNSSLFEHVIFSQIKSAIQQLGFIFNKQKTRTIVVIVAILLFIVEIVICLFVLFITHLVNTIYEVTDCGDDQSTHGKQQHPIIYYFGICSKIGH